MAFFLRIIAGAGLAPAPQGYEPCEILLLHPADFFIIEYFRRKCNFSYFNF